jgi:hypothetical protein
VQHYWQSHSWLLIFALWLILTAFVVRSRSIRLGIVMHVLTNSFGILATPVPCSPGRGLVARARACRLFKLVQTPSPRTT